MRKMISSSLHPVVPPSCPSGRLFSAQTKMEEGLMLRRPLCCSAICSLLLAASLLLASVAAARGQMDGSPPQQRVTFDHSRGSTTRALRVANGEEFTITLQNTCPTAFSYEVRPLRGELWQVQEPNTDSPVHVAGESEERLSRTVAAPSAAHAPPERSVQTLARTHSHTYSGYWLDVRMRDHPRLCANPQGEPPLEAESFIVLTPTDRWRLAFSVGVTATGLTDPVYALHPVPMEKDSVQSMNQEQADSMDQEPQRMIVREPHKRDKANMGLGAFVHAYHDRLPWLAPMMGVSLDRNRTEYLFGIGVRLNDSATINIGGVLGPVARLPAGINVEEAMDLDDDVLDNLPTRVRCTWAISVSISGFRNWFANTGAGG